MFEKPAASAGEILANLGEFLRKANLKTALADSAEEATETDPLMKDVRELKEQAEHHLGGATAAKKRFVAVLSSQQ